MGPNLLFNVQQPLFSGAISTSSTSASSTTTLSVKLEREKDIPAAGAIRLLAS